MKILSTPGWSDYELLDTGNGLRFERFGKYRLVRPDPQIIWQPKLDQKAWLTADAVFDIEEKKWIVKTTVPDKWLMRYKDISLIRLFNASFLLVSFYFSHKFLVNG